MRFMPIRSLSRVTPTSLLLLTLVVGPALPAAPVEAVELPDFTELVERSSPAVVNISTRQTRQRPTMQLPPGLEMPDLPEDSPFNEFFRRFFGEGEMEDFNAQSLGSGLIISSDGDVLTNNHVVANADEVIVRLSDRREFVAKVLGTDERSDVALLRIDATDLPVARIGSSRELKVGEWVLAIGSPFGFEHSVTAGIVSAKGRSLPRESYVPFIQTDVAINPGNSGGPLYNLDGEVVGINSQIFSRTGGFMGLSFAIPIDVAIDVAAQLKADGRVSRGWLGVLIQDVTRELAESFGMAKPEGALIARVLEGSPVAKAGMEVGDIVLRFDGKPVDHSADLPPIVGRTRVGTSVPVEILRGGKSRTLTVVTAELPEEEQLQLGAAPADEPGTASTDRLGIKVRELDAEQREQLEIGGHGVLVEKVKDGPARLAGIRDGDVLLMLNNEKVNDVDAFRRVVKALPAGKAVSVLVQRQGNPIFLALKAGE